MADVRRRLTLSEQLSSLPPSSSNLADLLKTTATSDDEVNCGGGSRRPALTLAAVIAGDSTASVTSPASATASVASPAAVFQPSPVGRTLLDIISDENGVAGGGAVSSAAGSGGWRALRDLLRFGATGPRNFRSDNASPIPGGGDVTPATSVDRQEMYLRVSTNAAAAEGQQQERMSLMALLEEADRQGGNVRGGLKAALAAAAAEEAEEEEEDAAAMAAAERTLNQDALLCCVCMVRKKGAAFIACGHTFCRSCARQLWVSRATCPLCNSIILDILDIF